MRSRSIPPISLGADRVITCEVHQSVKEKGSKPQPKDVEAYIAAAPAAVHELLRELRQAIKAAAPKAIEKISYGMPTYEYRGRIAYFAGYEKHVGLYGVVHEDRPVDEEARPYLENRSTLRFPVGHPLPVGMIKRVVSARVTENETSARTNPVRDKHE